MHVLGVIVFFAQALLPPVQGYVLPAPDDAAVLQLVLPDGRSDIVTGFNCDGIVPWQNVGVWQIANVPGQAVVAPIDNLGNVVTQEVVEDGLASTMCSVAFLAPLSGGPCMVDALARCDVMQELSLIGSPPIHIQEGIPQWDASAPTHR